MHVRAVLRQQAARHPPQAIQRHHVIEPQRRDVPHVVADQADERLVLLRAQLVRILRRNAPVLPLQRQRIGRRAHGCALQIQVTVRPGLRAGGVRADRDVAVQADRHAAARARVGLRLAQLLGREPLQIEEVLDVLRRARARSGSRPATSDRDTPPASSASPSTAVPAAADAHRARRRSRAAAAARPAPRRNCGTPGARRAAVQVLAAEARVQQLQDLELRAPRRARSRRCAVARSSLQQPPGSPARRRARAPPRIRRSPARPRPRCTARSGTAGSTGCTGLMCAGFAGISACSGFRPTMPQPSGAARRISSRRSRKSPMPQLRVERSE